MNSVARLFGRLCRVAACAAAAVIVTVSLSFADEQQFYRTSAWEIVLVTPTSAGNPYCEVRSVTWAAKRVSVKIVLTGVDEFETTISLQKEGWGLPVGENTTVGVMQNVGVAFPMNFTAIDPETLGAVPASDHIDVMAVAKLIEVLGGGKAASLTFVFQGDEEQWTVPAMTLYEARQFDSMYADCQNTLSAMGPKLFAGQQPQAKSTSPFSKNPAGNSGSIAGSPKGGITPSDRDTPSKQAVGTWEFTEGEEDWGKTCYLSAEVGKVTIGFLGVPGKAFTGYVDGLFDGDTRATWSIDNDPPNISDGAPSDYSGWHEFGDLPLTILDEVANGSKLAVTDRNGKRVVVSLNGATSAVSAFKQCDGGSRPESAASDGR